MCPRKAGIVAVSANCSHLHNGPEDRTAQCFTLQERCGMCLLSCSAAPAVRARLTLRKLLHIVLTSTMVPKTGPLLPTKFAPLRELWRALLHLPDATQAMLSKHLL